MRLVRIKRLLGLDAIVNDARGLKAPYKYADEIRSHIKKLLHNSAGWTDQAIAEQAAKNLGLNISRSSVARIRTANQVNGVGTKSLGRKDLMEMAKVADAIDREDFDAQQLSFIFEQDQQLKEKSEENYGMRLYFFLPSVVKNVGIYSSQSITIRKQHP